MSTQSTSLADELSAIEAVVSDYEEKIKDGRHSVENLKKQIEAVADPNEVMSRMNAGDNEWLDKWKKETVQLSGIDKINILRLSELKFQYPNESRIFKLGDRAVKCFLKLCEINCTVTERQFTPDLRPQIEASNREIMDGLRKMYSNMFTASPFVPSSQSHFADAFGATAKQNIDNSFSNRSSATNSNPKVSKKINKTKSNVFLIMGIIGVIGVIAVIVYFAIQPSPSLLWYTTDPKATNFTISTAEELANLAKIVNGTWGKKPKRDNFYGKTITLAGNIDLSQYSNWVPIGNYSVDSINIFSGTFNGSGHVISNLTINRSDDRQGLFGRIENGNVQNLGLDNVNIKGQNRVGAVAGVINGSKIIDCYSIGNISGTASIGGIVGTIAGNGNVSSSYSTAIVNGDAAVGGIAGGIIGVSSITNSYFTGTVSGNHGVGGVAGSAVDTSSVTGSYSTATVNGNEEVGGVVGQILSNSNIAYCYSTGTISGAQDRIGGIVGGVYKNSSVTNSYSTGTVTGREAVGGVAGGIYESRITNSYSIGAINGNDVVAGVTGAVRSGVVINCAALNPEVKSNINVGRVVSNAWNKFTLSNNVAYIGMINKAGNTKWVNKGMATRDGLDITIAAIQNDGTIGGRFTTANGWKVKNGNLPTLTSGGAASTPSHLRTKAKTDCTSDEVWENSTCRAKTEEEVCIETGYVWANGECKTLKELETACLAEDKIWENNTCKVKTVVIQQEHANPKEVFTNIKVDGQEEQDDE